MSTKKILGIETSCDDTSLCLLEGDPFHSGSAKMHFFTRYSHEEILKKWGGVVPEIAARNHLEKLHPLLVSSFASTGITPRELDAIAVTTHPGLLGPLLTGINAAKTLALLYELPILPVNHLYAHLEAIHLQEKVPYPYLGMLVSGGHSLFMIVKSSTEFTVLGSTIDDAAGEAFDKGGRLMGLPYPAGKLIDELAQGGDETKYSFPIGLKNSKDCRLSFSGVKTSLRFFLEENAHKHLILNIRKKNYHQGAKDLLASYRYAIVSALALKLRYAAKEAKNKVGYQLKIVVGGGVACNSRLRELLYQEYPQGSLYFVAPEYCTDNGAMVAHLGLLNYSQRIVFPKCLTVDAKSRFLKKNLNRDLPPPQKSWGQHYLKDSKTIARICQDIPQLCDIIVEVGSGTGALTHHLVQLKKPLIAIEKDLRLKEHLEDILSQHPDTKLVMNDALRVDYLNLWPQDFHNLWMVSNLPYQVAAPLMIKFFPLENVTHMTLMMQKEMAQKILPPKEGKKEEKNMASSLWALAQNYFEVKKITHVSPGAFHPPPKVDSTVLSFKRHKYPVIKLDEFSNFESFLRKLFSHPRKQVSTVLSSHYGSEKTIAILKELSIPVTLRAERFYLQQVQTLFKRWHG